mgnify:CR=1 FL=1|jgi:hypothetical protein
MKLSHLLLLALLSTGFAGATSTEYIEAKQLFTDKSYDLAYDKASKLSASGDADAANLVGLMYLYSLGIKGSYESAIKMFNKADAQGSQQAKINLQDIQNDYEKLLIKYQKENHKHYQQKLVSWLSTIDSKYKDKMLSNNGELFTLPMPGKFVNAYPYNKGDHPELPPKRKSFNTISYTLKDDLKKHILGGEAEFLYLSVLVWRNVTGLESVPMLKKDAKAVIKKLLKPLIEDFTGDLIEAKNLSFELIIDEDNAFGYFITVDGFEIAITRFTLKEKIFTMVLANGNPNISKPVKEDMIEWVNLILEANK